MGYHTPPLPTGTVTLAADCLEGAGQVAVFLYGRDDPTTRRRVYRLATELPPEQRPPFFKMGDNIIRARRSRLLDWVAAKEVGGAD